MKILGLIPARGGSKGIPGKNIKSLGGKALIEYAIEAGLASGVLERVVVSTDDEKIAKVSQRAGAQVPFLRPAALATDQSPTIDTVIHALQFFQESGIDCDAVCLLQPTSPLRKVDDIKMAVETFIKQQADSLISVREVPHTYNPHWVFEEDIESGFLKIATGEESIISRRQDLPKAFHRDGSIYLCKTSVVLNERSLYGKKIAYYLMKNKQHINLDTMEDWVAAEAMINQWKK